MRSPKSNDLIKAQQHTLVFVNTRSQAEMLFQDLWRMNDDGLAIALHHGSLDVAQRRKVEDAMAAGKLRGVVCTSRSISASTGAMSISSSISRAEGRLTADAADRPRQSRIDEASRACWCGQSLRGAGMRGGDRRGGRECAGYPRCGSVRWMCWRSMCSAALAASRFCPISFYEEV